MKTFLKAEWRKLAIVNYAVDAKRLGKYIPYKTEIDTWENTCYLSLVGFMFLNTTVRGLSIPFHINFEEVNLRFYVRHHDGNKWKRGVVFIREIVPRPALTLIANMIYGEHYQTLPMDHLWTTEQNSLSVEYSWKKREWNHLKVKAENKQIEITDGSEEEFITEHFWGYTQISNSMTSEYEVEHPRWKIYPVIEQLVDVDFGNVYGGDFVFLSEEKPKSVFLAEGSNVSVREGVRIK